MNKSSKNIFFALIGGTLTSLLISIGIYYYNPFDINPQGIFVAGLISLIIIFAISKSTRDRS
jgi:hypothetical protein